MDNRGGKREGAGRKVGSTSKGTKVKMAALDVMRKLILKKWKPLIQIKMDLAEGIYVEKPIFKKGKQVDTKIYQKPPDGDSIEYLLSMVVGKPKEEKILEVKGLTALLDEINAEKEQPVNTEDSQQEDVRVAIITKEPQEQKVEAKQSVLD